MITGRHIELGNGSGGAGSGAPDDVLGGLGLTRAPSPALVGALDAPSKKLFSLTWSNHDDTWFFGILAINAANGTVQGVGWAPDA